MCMINVYYLQDVIVNIHHFDDAFYRLTYQFLLLAESINKKMLKQKKKKSMQKTEINNKKKCKETKPQIFKRNY